MGHYIAWDNEEKTVVLQQYTEDPGKNDLYDLARKSAEMLNSVDHTVHLIIDESNVDLTLNSADLKFLEQHVPANQGAVAVIVPPGHMAYKTVMQNVGKAVAPKAFDKPVFVSSVEEAREVLQQNFGVTYP